MKLSTCSQSSDAFVSVSYLFSSLFIVSVFVSFLYTSGGDIFSSSSFSTRSLSVS